MPGSILKPPTNRIVVSFPAGRLEWLRQLATQRSAGKRQAGVGNQRVDSKRTDFDVDYLGLRMEDAVASLLGVKLDERIHLHGDEGHDLRLHDIRISVKAAFAKRNPAFVQRKPDFRADVGVLGTDGPGEDVTILGWMESGEWHAWRYEEDLGYGLNWIVRAEQLHPMDELMRWAGQMALLKGARFDAS